MNMFNDPWELLNKAWIALAAILAFFAKKHLDEDRSVAARVGALEKVCATRDDVEGLHSKIDENHRQVINLLSQR